MVEGQSQDKLEQIIESSEIEEHRKEAHRLASRTGLGPDV